MVVLTVLLDRKEIKRQKYKEQASAFTLRLVWFFRCFIAGEEWEPFIPLIIYYCIKQFLERSSKSFNYYCSKKLKFVFARLWYCIWSSLQITKRAFLCKVHFFLQNAIPTRKGSYTFICLFLIAHLWLLFLYYSLMTKW
jgi:hypothetical protein